MTTAKQPKVDRMNDDGRVLDQIVRESRTGLQSPSVEWPLVEEKLFARIDADLAEQASLARFRGSRGWGVLAGLAAAAAAVVLLGRPAGRGAVDPSGPRSPAAMAVTGTTADNASSHPMHALSKLSGRQGRGAVRVASGASEELTPASAATLLSPGSRVQTQADARGLWDTGRTTWLLEQNSRVSVKTADPLVLGLEEGVVEAQVDPVANGEAFAVDVGDVRIAVHGTHLRVARVGNRVSVDLTEGVVSIGRPPRVGSTYGTLVVAPAHVEFEIADLGESLRMTHAIGAVRPATSFATSAGWSAPLAQPLSAGLSALTSPTSAGSPAEVSPSGAPGEGAGTGPSVPQPEASLPSPVRSSSTGVSRPSATQPPPVARIDPRADDTVGEAVRACAAAAPHSLDVTVTVSSTLELTVGDDGFVRAARFSPPLAPEIQSCASAAIYKIHFAETGPHTVSILLAR